MMIIYQIDRPQDLHSLCLTSRNFCNISWPCLYKYISTRLDIAGRRFPGMTTMDIFSHIQLFKALETPRLACLVTDFRIYIAICSCKSERQSYKNDNVKCSALDSQLGRALVSLENLQVLHFTCRGCDSRPSTPHRYLAELKTKKLHELEFYCGCSLQRGVKASDFLAAPCMQSITSLAMYGYDGSSDAVLRDKSCLSQLDKLLCLYWSNLDALLSKGTVTRLALDQPAGDKERLLDILQRHPRSLTHFSIANSDTYPAFMSTRIEIFSKLQFVGKLHFTMSMVRT